MSNTISMLDDFGVIHQ